MDIPIPKSIDFTANLFVLKSVIKVPKQLILTRVCVTVSALTEVRPTVPASVARLRVIAVPESELPSTRTGLGTGRPRRPV